MQTSDAMRTMGYEVLWDDAGWSSYPGNVLPPKDYGSVFVQTYEGPDFSQTQQYLQKAGMHGSCGSPAVRRPGFWTATSRPGAILNGGPTA